MTGPEHCREAERLQVHAQELLTAGVYDAEESLQRAAAVLADAANSRPLRTASPRRSASTRVSFCRYPVCFGVVGDRRAAANFYNNRRSSSDIRAAIGEKAYRTRVAAQSAYYELLLTTDDPETIHIASLCMGAVTKIDESEGQETIDDNHQKSQLYLGDMIAAARKVQSGAFEGLGRIADDQGLAPVKEARNLTF